MSKPLSYVWPPNYVEHAQWRTNQIALMRSDKKVREASWQYYKHHPAEFISHWCDTYDPRNAGRGRLVRMPMKLFPRQIELVGFLRTCLEQQVNGLIEKSRDMGATWTSCGFSVWLWLFYDGSSIGWGSRKAQLVDRLGDMDSIFEKIRFMISGLPPEFQPWGWSGEMYSMKIINPENGSSITGESGDDIGRGGRKLIYFKDESAHYEHPESIEAALGDNTRVQIDISSVHGLGNVFHRKREAGVLWVPGAKLEPSKTAVFVMDWRDHPEKDMEWYRDRESAARDNGLLHVFRQEVDRDYSAAIEGTICPAEWVRSAIDAHRVLGFSDDGAWTGALDVADEGGDRNALAQRKGVVLRYVDEWGERDTGATARRAIAAVSGSTPIQVMYDCIGVGAGVKAETNRLREEKLMPKGIEFIAWDAAAGPNDPDAYVIEDDPESPINRDFYANLKAQGWWELRRRFEKTHRAINEKVKYPVDELISIDSSIPKLQQLVKELSQPTSRKTGRMKLVVEKAPKGTRSPNMGDAVMMCYWPAPESLAYDETLSWVI